ncbi:HSP70/90 co-chaperone [Spiromyces aspiralis]|uniref:HSP70/90 co-chaperone n=1 Tax=Spiromyces aspiralis TaxID=68401 RepID=A0ACC1HXE5_9FUNG|nr:HSP70/90 co-chaperone [Spiromyces aspiralis]
MARPENDIITEEPIGPARFRVEGALNPDKLDEELNSVPLFMQTMPTEEEIESNVALSALQSLAYDGTPDEIAQNFREQGNDFYKEKNYQEAAKYYTQALGQNFQDDKLREMLLTNRAACNLELIRAEEGEDDICYYQALTVRNALENYRRVINDCAAALRLNKSNVKALFRSAKACYALEKLDEAIECCDWAQRIDSNNSAVQALRARSEAKREELAELERRRREREEKEREQRRLLENAIAIRNLKFERRTKPSEEEGESEAERQPWENNSERQVQLNQETGHLLWPVFFLYPEHRESDFIEAFDEATTLGEQISTVLQVPPPWDNSNPPAYRLDNVDMYFLHRPENGVEDDETLVKVGLNCPLATAISHPKYTIVNGIPSFIVLPKSGKFLEGFLDIYRKRRLAREQATKKTHTK